MFNMFWSAEHVYFVYVLPEISKRRKIMSRTCFLRITTPKYKWITDYPSIWRGGVLDTIIYNEHSHIKKKIFLTSKFLSDKFGYITFAHIYMFCPVNPF